MPQQGEVVLYTGPTEYFGSVMRITGSCHCHPCRFAPIPEPHYGLAARGAPIEVLTHVPATSFAVITRAEAEEYEAEAWTTAFRRTKRAA